MRPISVLPFSGLAVIVVLLGGCGAAPPSEAAGARGSLKIDQMHTVKTLAEVSELGGFSVTTKVSFPDRRNVVEVRYDLPETAHQVVYPLRGKPRGVAELPFVAEAGSQMTVLATYAPDCSDAEAPPLLIIRTTDLSGQEHIEGFESPDADQFRVRVQDHCQRGAVGRVTGSRQHVDGTFEVYVTVFNPGPGSLNLVSDAYEMDGTRWFRASTSIDVMHEAELTFLGEGDGCTSATPWETGHLTTNGEPLTFDGAYAEQC